MKRLRINHRNNWQRIVSQQGLIYHTANGRPYWDESVCYAFTAKEVDQLEAATNELVEMFLKAGQYIIDNDLFDRMRIPKVAVPWIKTSWDTEPPSIYGRFDLAFDGEQIKLLEFNADTPTSLLEAAVIQWYWLEDVQTGKDQFNSIHERLIAKWKELLEYCTNPLYFAHIEDNEDAMTVTYLRQTAQEAGHKTLPILMREIGWDTSQNTFVDGNRNKIYDIFKLYPWEWMVHEPFAEYIGMADTQWIEPAWRMMWSNKAILPILWEMYPHHPLLLESHMANDGWKPSNYIDKPIFGREGHNITVIREGQNIMQTDGEYGEEGYVRQTLAPIPCIDGNYPVIGSWVIDLVSAGMGIRENSNMVSDNLSRFVPHYFE